MTILDSVGSEVKSGVLFRSLSERKRIALIFLIENSIPIMKCHFKYNVAFNWAFSWVAL